MKITATTATHEAVTGRTPGAWALGRGDEAQSTTFRALAWSQEDDGIAGPLPYTGEQYQECGAADSRPIVRITADTAEPASGPRYQRSNLIYGIAAGFVAAAIGGLLITVMNTDDGPVAIPTKVETPAAGFVKSQPESKPVPVRSSSPAPMKTAIAPARIVPSSVAPSHAVAAPAPELQTTAAPEVSAPAAVGTDAAAPADSAPAAAAPSAAAPEFTPPGTKPPVWVPPVTPQPVPHPVGPPDFHVDPLPNGGITLPPVTVMPAAPDTGISLKPGIMIPTIIPTVIPTVSAG